MTWNEQLKQILKHYQGFGAIAALARDLPVSQTTLHGWLKNRRVPDNESQQKIARLYRIKEGS
jgi:transcriptional regulator with XRE-family HTH domain